MRMTAVINDLCMQRRNSGKLRRFLDRLSCSHTVCEYHVNEPAEATALAVREKNSDGFIVAGGDGTASGVINGMDLSRQGIFVLPLGTGNGFAADRKMRLDVTAAATGTISVRTADLLRVRWRTAERECSRYAISTSAVGFVAQLVDHAHRHGLRRLGPLCYPFSGGFCYFHRRPVSCRIRIEGGAEERLSLTNMVVNNTAYSGNLRLFPRAAADDGMFEAILEGQETRRLQGLECMGVDYDEPMQLMLDGDIVENVTAMEYRIASGALRYFTFLPEIPQQP